MNEMTTGFPILTLLTVLPLVGAAIALFSGRHARGVALFTALVMSRRLRCSSGRTCPPTEASAWSSCTRGRLRSALNIISASMDWAR